MSGLLQNGIQERDIAILVGKSRELDKVQNTLQDIHLDDNAASGRKKDIVDICTARFVLITWGLYLCIISFEIQAFTI